MTFDNNGFEDIKINAFKNASNIKKNPMYAIILFIYFHRLSGFV